MIWDRLMALFCKAVGHAVEIDLDGCRCVRCGEPLLYEANTADAMSYRWTSTDGKRWRRK